jgi:zinc-ribbon domain
MTSGPDRSELEPPRDDVDAEAPDEPQDALAPAAPEGAPPPSARTSPPSDTASSGGEEADVVDDARRAADARSRHAGSSTAGRPRRLRFWESQASDPTPASPEPAVTAEGDDDPASTPASGSDDLLPREGLERGPDREPGGAPSVQEAVPGFERMDTSSMPVADAPPPLPPFTDPPARRLPDLRRHLRFWEVAPESVAERLGEAGDDDGGAAPDRRPIWEWADDGDLGVDPASSPIVGVGPEALVPPLPASPPRFGTLAELRAESRELRRRIHDLQFDLGGLHVEMARAAAVDHALLEARALELVAAGDRLVAVERAMEARRRGEDPSWAALVPCSSCGAPRPHDASFCPYCGSSVAPARAWRAG